MAVRWILLGVLLLGPPVNAGPAADPVGAWKIVDDKTGQERAVIRIELGNGVLTGRIERSLDPHRGQETTCSRCPGDRKDQPLLGMAILTGLRQDGDPRIWSGGEILDPESGDTYKAKLVVAPDGQTMEVRGYVGLPILGRSQTWLRTE